MKIELLVRSQAPERSSRAEEVPASAGVSLVFQRNLLAMIRALLARSVPCASGIASSSVDERARDTVDMLLAEFPKLKDFERLRALGKLYETNEFRMLNRVRAPAELEAHELPRELACRFYEGWFVLADDEALVLQKGLVQGPFERRTAITLAKRLSAASPTNDDQGHILDPEQHQPFPASVLLPRPEPVQHFGGP